MIEKTLEDLADEKRIRLAALKTLVTQMEFYIDTCEVNGATVEITDCWNTKYILTFDEVLPKQ